MEVRKNNTLATQTEHILLYCQNTSQIHTYLTMLGWLSSLSREISRIAVLGTPSVSLGEVEKAEIGMWLQILLSPQPGSFLSSQGDTTPASPRKVRNEKRCCRS